MTWVLPKTWTPGRLAKAAELNTYLRDALEVFESAINTDTGELVATAIGDRFVLRQTGALAKTSDVAVADLPGLSFPIGAGESWVWTAYLIGRLTLAGGGRFVPSGPAGISGRYGVAGGGGGSTQTGAWGTEITLEGAGDLAVFTGRAENGGTAGTLKFRFAQKTSSVSTSTIEADSFVIVERFTP